MQDMFRKVLRPWRAGLDERAPAITLDVHESDGHCTVRAEVPGVRNEDIEVRIDGRQVTLSAEVTAVRRVDPGQAGHCELRQRCAH